MTISYSPSSPIEVVAFEDTGLVVMARVLGQDGEAVTQASLDSIAMTSMDLDDYSSVATAALTISAVVFDTLQTADPRWTADQRGYNFLYAIPATAIPSPGKTYRVGLLFTPSSGQPFALAVDITTRRLQP